MSKICTNCGKTVEDNTNYCPYCKNQSFTNQNELTVPENNLTHKLFYKKYDNYYKLSKAKLTAIVVFLFFSIPSSLSGAPLAIVIIISLILALITYCIGFIISKFRKPPLKEQLLNNDHGFFVDLKHLLLYWQNKQGDYVLSKTKIISHLVFVIFFIIASTSHLNSFMALLFIGLIFEIPTFLIGYVLHKLINPNPQLKNKNVKIEKVDKPEIESGDNLISENKIIPEYIAYNEELMDLKSKFIKKDKSVRDLIKQRFEPPQLTYTRFISGVDKSKELFNKHLDSALTMINLADEYSSRIDGEIKSNINILHEIIDKLDALTNELIINEDLSNKDDVDSLIDEMDDLIKSVKNY
ncbi:MAG: hypothetical protein E7Z80_06980 [Methanobrevibacter thaueri]|nr:hypothetical protein [Methanobrevibacter thaueri]